MASDSMALPPCCTITTASVRRPPSERHILLPLLPPARGECWIDTFSMFKHRTRDTVSRGIHLHSWIEKKNKVLKQVV